MGQEAGRLSRCYNQGAAWKEVISRFSWVKTHFQVRSVALGRVQSHSSLLAVGRSLHTLPGGPLHEGKHMRRTRAHQQDRCQAFVISSDLTATTYAAFSSLESLGLTHKGMGLHKGVNTRWQGSWRAVRLPTTPLWLMTDSPDWPVNSSHYPPVGARFTLIPSPMLSELSFH